jgi:hypothetical protein
MQSLAIPRPSQFQPIFHEQPVHKQIFHGQTLKIFHVQVLARPQFLVAQQQLQESAFFFQ